MRHTVAGTCAVLLVFLISAPHARAQSAFLSAGGTVVGPTDVCLSMNGGVGLLFHLIPDARVLPSDPVPVPAPLVPPDYIWTPTTITLPIPEVPPKIGDQVLGLVYPGFAQSLCIIQFLRFGALTKGGWQFYYMGVTSPVPALPVSPANILSNLLSS